MEPIIVNKVVVGSHAGLLAWINGFLGRGLDEDTKILLGAFVNIEESHNEGMITANERAQLYDFVINKLNEIWVDFVE